MDRCCGSPAAISLLDPPTATIIITSHISIIVIIVIATIINHIAIISQFLLFLLVTFLLFLLLLLLLLHLCLCLSVCVSPPRSLPVKVLLEQNN